MLRTLVLLLLTCGCALAGQVKTFDGLKIDKDSSAELRLYYQEGKYFDPYSFQEFVAALDSTRLYDVIVSGEDFTQSLPDEQQIRVYQAWIDSNAAQRLRKLILQPREYRVVLQATLEDHRKGSEGFNITQLVTLTFTPEAGQKYEIRAVTDGTTWTFWIQDQKTKQVVASNK